MKYIGFLIYALLILSGCQKADAVAASSNNTISGVRTIPQ
jgi:sugar phosphate permease